MLTALPVVCGLSRLGPAVYGTRLYLRQRSWYDLLALLARYGLANDNFAIAAGTRVIALANLGEVALSGSVIVIATESTSLHPG